jgi:Alternative oxidase
MLILPRKTTDLLSKRMHLLTFVRMKDPGYLFRGAVIAGQFGFGAVFTLAYIVSPAFCHRFVGYVEEEACSTYTKIIKTIEAAPEGEPIAAWRTQTPPKIAIAYWKLGEHGTVLDLMKAVRADEAEHRDVNHLISGVKDGDINPLYDPESRLDLMLKKYVKAIMSRGKE